MPDWRVSLVWRLYGWAGLQEVLVLRGPLPWSKFFAASSWWLDAFLLCSAILLLAGPRPALLLATGVASAGVLWVMASGLDPFLNFPGAEMPLFTALPLASVAVWGLARIRGQDDDEWTASLLGTYRLAFVVEMAFAAVHKMNRDFFDPELSCAGVLSQMLPEWWDSSVAWFARFLEPPVVLALEGLLPLLSYLYWPLGLLVSITFFVGLAVLGPTGFTGVSLAAAFAFVRGTTARDFFRVPRRRPLAIVAGVVGLVAYVAWVYRGPRMYPWPQFALYCSVVGVLAVCLVDEILRDVRGARPGGCRSVLPLRGPRSAVQRGFLVLLLGLGIANGLMPYFGYRYHFSFSMLSNLRADAVRWNSFVVPESFRLVDRDPFVHVRRVRIRRDGGRETTPDRELFEAYFPPYEFLRRVRYHLNHGHDLTLWLEWDGEKRVLHRVRGDDEAEAFLDSLPRGLLFQKVLMDGPQPCVH